MRKCKGTYIKYNKEKRMYETHGFEEGLYDRDNGVGAAQNAIDSLKMKRKTR